MIRLVAMLLVAALAATPAAALAQDNPFLPPVQQQQAPAPAPSTPPPPAPVEDRDDGDGLGPGIAIALALIVVGLIGGIWFFITRDARAAAPDRRRSHTARTEPDAFERATPGSRGRHHTRASSSRKLSKREKQRRKRGRAR